MESKHLSIVFTDYDRLVNVLRNVYQRYDTQYLIHLLVSKSVYERVKKENTVFTRKGTEGIFVTPKGLHIAFKPVEKREVLVVHKILGSSLIPTDIKFESDAAHDEWLWDDGPSKLDNNSYVILRIIENIE